MQVGVNMLKYLIFINTKRKIEALGLMKHDFKLLKQLTEVGIVSDA